MSQSHRGDAKGVWVRGAHPQELVLSDGSRLALDAAGGGAEWRRLDDLRGVRERISVRDAASAAGEHFRGYVAVRTRAEAEWLRALADWCEQQAGRLEAELAAA